MNTIILAGGKGERLRPLTLTIPKPMVEVRGNPILWYILNQLDNSGIRKVTVMVGYKSEVIKKYLSQNFTHMHMNIIDGGDIDIIERIKSVTSLSPEEDVLVLYGDTVSNVDITKLLEFHQKNAQLGTLTVWPLKTNFGLVELNDKSEIIQFKEKPRLDKWINIGYFIINKELFTHLNNFDAFADFLNFCGKEKLLKAYKHESEHYTVNNLVELAHLEENVNKVFKF
jgi:glucose-1-phosphate cytidylyltransferase